MECGRKAADDGFGTVMAGGDKVGVMPLQRCEPQRWRRSWGEGMRGFVATEV